MSTTAGITTQEYVAINIPSIVALFLGLAGVLAVLWPVLLLVPAAGVVVGLIALAQIRASNGTQTGRGFALLGSSCRLAIGSFVAVRSVIERNQSGADRRRSSARSMQLGRHVASRSMSSLRDVDRPLPQPREPLANSRRSGRRRSLPHPGPLKSNGVEQDRHPVPWTSPIGVSGRTGLRVGASSTRATDVARHPLIFRKVERPLAGRRRAADVPHRQQQRRQHAVSTIATRNDE